MAVQDVIRQIMMYPLSEFDGRMKSKFWTTLPTVPSDTTGDEEVKWVAPDKFFDVLPQVLDDAPPLPVEEARYAQLRAILAAAAEDPKIKAVLAQAAPDKGKGGKYLIPPPGGPDVSAPGYIVKRSPTNQVWFATRGLDPKTAQDVLRKHRLYAWKDHINPPAMTIVPVNGKDWSSEQPRDLEYWQYLSDVLAPEPPEARDGFFYAMLLPLGIEIGKPFAPDERQKRILTQAAVFGDLLGRLTAYSKRIAGAVVWP
jgi:hypothetical protein